MNNSDQPVNDRFEYVLTSFVAGAQTRKYVYGAFVLIGLIITGVITYFGATSLDLPSWVIGANAVYNMLSASGFVLAIGNTPKASLKPAGPVPVADVAEGSTDDEMKADGQ